MSNSDSPVRYAERVLPSLTFFAALLFLPVAVIAILIPFSAVVAATSAVISYICATALVWLLSPRITIDKDFLTVGKASIPIKYLGDASVIERSEAFVERGRNLNPLAFTRFQIGVNQLARVELKDSDDPTPYWLFSTRNPELVASYLKKLS
jgi:hypothetical protein